MKMKLNINRETKSITIYLRKSDLKNLIQQRPPDRSTVWFSNRLKEITFILHDAIMNDYPEFKPSICIVSDDEFNDIILDEKTELIIINRMYLT